MTGSEFEKKACSFLRTLTGSDCRERTRAKPGSTGLEEGQFHFLRTPNPGRVWSSENDRPNPGLAGLEFGERLIPFSELRTLAGSGFGERTGLNLGSSGSEFGEKQVPWQVPSSGKGQCRTKVRPIPFSKLRTCQTKKERKKENRKNRKNKKKKEKKKR